MMTLLLPVWMGGLLLSATIAPLGALVNGRGMLYFADAFAHAALLGVALAHYTCLSPLLSLCFVGVLLALSLEAIQRHSPQLSLPLLLMLFSQSSLALGTVLLYHAGQGAHTIARTLFGEVLTLCWSDLPLIAALTGATLSLLWWFWHPILSSILSAELAQVEGLSVRRYRALLQGVTIVALAISMQYFGSLLVITLLTLPSATVQARCNGPEAVAKRSIPIGMLSTTLGLAFSAAWDLPTTPMIVCMAALIFAVSLCSRS